MRKECPARRSREAVAARGGYLGPCCARGRGASGAREATRDITPLLRIGSPDPNLPYGCGVSIVEEFNKVPRIADVCGRLPSIV